MRRTLYVLVCDICFTSTCIALANRQPIDTYTQSRRFFYLKGRMFGKCERQQNNSRKMMQKTKAIRKKKQKYFHTNAPFTIHMDGLHQWSRNRNRTYAFT